ncbi:MAG: Hsp20/alpha crystallin family protein [Acholeplasmataceae bacterium]
MFYLNPNRARRSGTHDLLRVFDDLFTDSSLRQKSALPLDVREYEGYFLIEVDVPGVAKEAIVLNYENDLLSIGVEQEEQDDDHENYLYRERSTCKTERKLDLGELDPERIDAELKDGVLRIKAYKNVAENQRRTIEIK